MNRPSALYTFLKPKPVIAEPVTEQTASEDSNAAQQIQTRLLLQSSAINTLLSTTNTSIEQLGHQVQQGQAEQIDRLNEFGQSLDASTGSLSRELLELRSDFNEAGTSPLHSCKTSDQDY